MANAPDTQRNGKKEAAQRAAEVMVAAMREKGVEQDAIDASLKELGEKCGYEIEAVSIWRPFGGAKSFSELETWQRGIETRNEYEELNYQLRSLMENVLDDAALSDRERSDAITQLAADFADRADAIPGHAEDTVADMTPGARSLGERVRDGISTLFGRKADAGPSSFTAFKEGDAWRWFAVYSNRYRDKYGELFPEQAHKDFIAWADQDPTKRYPELWDWHTPIGLTTFNDGRRGMGRADFLDYQDGLALAGGYFYPEFAGTAELLSQEKDLGTSHGYNYAPWALNKGDGSYAHYFTFEISPLPRTKAANESTLFLPNMGTKEALMKFSDSKRAQLVAHHGEAKVKALEGDLDRVSTSLKESGIDFKDLDEVLEHVQPSAAAEAAQESTVPSAATPADGTKETPAAATEAGIKALTDALTPVIETAVGSALEPFETRMKALEADLDTRVAANFGPRVVPSPDKAPTADAGNVQNANTKEVQDAKKSGDEPDLANVPEHLKYYVGAAPALFGSSFSDSVQEAIAAAGK